MLATQAEEIMNALNRPLDTKNYWLYEDFKKSKQPILIREDQADGDLKANHMFDLQLFPAPTVAELGVLLGEYTVMRYTNHDCWKLYDSHGVLTGWFSATDNEAQARTNAFIFLLENGFLKEEDLKL